MTFMISGLSGDGWLGLAGLTGVILTAASLITCVSVVTTS
jgi:hypothetical protein